MNPYGSYRALLGNSMSAMLAGIEIYNKPRIEYRSECFVILLLNSWELLFKAICSKNRIRIFEPKERDKPYKTLNFFASLEAAKAFFPGAIQPKAVSENLERLVDYRNNAVHFYNEESLGVLVYGLAQTSIVNYRDIVYDVFAKDIASEVNISLLPLSFSAPPDPIRFLGSKAKYSQAVSEFMKMISDTTKDLEIEGVDTGRFLTVFEVSLQSTKKIKSADIIAGIDNAGSAGVLLVNKKVDPNKSHPLLANKVVKRVGNKVVGIKFTSYTFQAITWKYDIKSNDRYCWKNEHANTFQYSNDLVTWIKGLSADDVQSSLEEYKNRDKPER